MMVPGTELGNVSTVTLVCTIERCHHVLSMTKAKLSSPLSNLKNTQCYVKQRKEILKDGRSNGILCHLPSLTM